MMGEGYSGLKWGNKVAIVASFCVESLYLFDSERKKEFERDRLTAYINTYMEIGTQAGKKEGKDDEKWIDKERSIKLIVSQQDRQTDTVFIYFLIK